MPRRNRARRGGKGHSNADRLVTIAVVGFLVLVIGGAIALQLTANRGPASTPVTQISPQAAITVPPTQGVQRMTVDQAKQMVDAGQAVLVDTRSTQSYQTIHVAGSISFPEGDEEASFSRLPPDKVLIFYCT